MNIAGKELQSLTGIEQFKYLQSIDVSNNKLIHL